MRRCPLIGPRGPGRMLPQATDVAKRSGNDLDVQECDKEPNCASNARSLATVEGLPDALAGRTSPAAPIVLMARNSRSPRSSTPAVTERAGTAMAPANAACVCCVSGSRSRRVGAPRLAAPRALSCRQGGPSGNRRPPVGTAARRRTGPVSAITRRKPGCRRACIGWQATNRQRRPAGRQLHPRPAHILELTAGVGAKLECHW